MFVVYLNFVHRILGNCSIYTIKCSFVYFKFIQCIFTKSFTVLKNCSMYIVKMLKDFEDLPLSFLLLAWRCDNVV